MRSRVAIFAWTCAAFAAAWIAFPAAVEWLVPRAGLVRTFFPQPGFSGTPIEEPTSEINLVFLDSRPEWPRQNFSARWRGFLFVSQPHTIEFFAGGNDEVELRVDGQLLVRRSLREGMRTQGRRLALDAGAHELAVDYQQFGGGMALNIQRALAGQMPGPFLPTELFSQRVESRHVRMLDTARWVRRTTPIVFIAMVVLLVGSFATLKFPAWRRSAGAPKNLRDLADRVWLVAAPAVLAPAVVFLLGPYTIFASNPGEFAVPFRQLAAPWLLKTAAINWLILFGVGCLMALVSRTAVRVYAAVLFAFGLVLWAQGHLWNADYGVLAGRDIDLAEHSSRSPYETAA